MLGVEVGEGRVRREVGRVPRKIHPGIVAPLARREQIKEWHTRPVVNAGVARDPLLAIQPRAVEGQRFEQRPIARRMNFVDAEEAIRFAVLPGHVLARQDRDQALAVFSENAFVLHDQTRAEMRRDRDQLLRQVEVVVRLALVGGDDVTVIPTDAVVRHAGEEGSEAEVEGLAVLLRPAEQRQVVRDASVVVDGVEHVAENLLSIGFDDRQDRCAVQPADQVQEVEDRRAPSCGRRRWHGRSQCVNAPECCARPRPPAAASHGRGG